MWKAFFGLFRTACGLPPLLQFPFYWRFAISMVHPSHQLPGWGRSPTFDHTQKPTCSVFLSHFAARGRDNIMPITQKQSCFCCAVMPCPVLKDASNHPIFAARRQHVIDTQHINRCLTKGHDVNQRAHMQSLLSHQLWVSRALIPHLMNTCSSRAATALTKKQTMHKLHLLKLRFNLSLSPHLKALCLCLSLCLRKAISLKIHSVQQRRDSAVISAYQS